MLSVYPYNISLKIKGFDLSQLLKICLYIKKICIICGARSVSIAFLPIKKKHISVCRSPHVHKKSRTQFIYKRHKVVFSFQICNLKALQESLFFFKTSYLPGVEYELNISEKTYLFFCLLFLK